MIVGMDIEGMPEDERLATLESLEAERPGLASLVAGKLAGRATPGRPDVPVWDYELYVTDHADVELEDLAVVRFPVVFFGGDEFTITSASEELRADASSLLAPITLDSVIDKWRRLHAAGVVRWDSTGRAVEHVRSFDDYKVVIAEWGTALGRTHTPGSG